MIVPSPATLMEEGATSSLGRGAVQGKEEVLGYSNWAPVLAPSQHPASRVMAGLGLIPHLVCGVVFHLMLPRIFSVVNILLCEQSPPLSHASCLLPYYFLYIHPIALSCQKSIRRAV